MSVQDDIERAERLLREATEMKRNAEARIKEYESLLIRLRWMKKGVRIDLGKWSDKRTSR